MNEQSTPEDSLSHEKRRSETWLGYGKFALIAQANILAAVLIIVLIFYGLPAMDAWSDSSVKTASSMGKLATLIDQAGPQVQATLANVNATTANVKDGSEQFVQLIARFPSLFDDLQKTLATARQGVDRTTTGIAGTMQEAQSLVRDFNARLNGDFGLLVGLTKLTTELGTDIGTLKTALVGMINEGTTTIKDIRAYLLDPQWAEARAQVVQLLTHADQLAVNAVGITGSTDKIMKSLAEKAPGFFALLEKVMRASQRFQKPILILTVLGLLTKALAGVVF